MSKKEDTYAMNIENRRARRALVYLSLNWKAGTSTNLPVESASDKKSVKKVKVTEKKVQEENKENTTPTSAVFRSEPEKKEKKVEKRLNLAKKVGIGRIIQIPNTCFLCSQRFKLKGPNFTPCFSCKNNTSED